MTGHRWSPTDYAKHSTGQRQWAEELLAKLQLQPGESVLDIGCGDGRNTARIAELVAPGSVTGIDSSEAMVEQARTSYPPDRHTNLSFEQCDARELGFDGRFDAVFSNATLHWVDDHRAVLLGIARALKSGGRAVLQMGGRGNAADVVAIMYETMEQTRWRDHFRDFAFPYTFLAPEDYAPWLSEAGLTMPRGELLPKKMVHPTSDAFAGWIRTTWMPFTHRVPEEHRDDFIDAFVERYLERHPTDEQGQVHVEMIRLEVELRFPHQSH